MSSGKTSKYFKYAIGEILLVVIGILIALQINNWNEHRKIRINELTYLENISADLQLNITALQEFITSREVCIEASINMIAMFEGEKPIDVDEFNRNGIEVMVWYPFQQNDNTYQELLNSGKLSLISNKTIKNQLQNMQTSFKKVTFVENEMQQDYERYLYEPFFNYADLNTSFKNYNAQIANAAQTESLDIEQVKRLLKNQLFKNGFVLSAYNSELLINEYSVIMETTRQLISLIENELSQ